MTKAATASAQRESPEDGGPRRIPIPPLDRCLILLCIFHGEEEGDVPEQESKSRAARAVYFFLSRRCRHSVSVSSESPVFLVVKSSRRGDIARYAPGVVNGTTQIVASSSTFRCVPRRFSSLGLRAHRPAHSMRLGGEKDFDGNVQTRPTSSSSRGFAIRNERQE